MNIEQAVKDAIEEFGKFAYERFTDDKGFLFESNDELNRELVGWCDIQLKPLPELFEHDVKFYGDDAYLMWDVDTQWILNFNFSFNCNFTAECALTDDRSLVKRKNSSALPFDLERAKAGDIVEWINRLGEWETINSISCIGNDGFFIVVTNDFMSHSGVTENDLRMKYPNEVKITEQECNKIVWFGFRIIKSQNNMPMEKTPPTEKNWEHLNKRVYKGGKK